MQLRTGTVDGLRVSVSSTPSCSSGGSGPDDAESLGDVYIWGETWNVAANISSSPVPVGRNDTLVPKPLESSLVLDVHQISCGAHHVALVTRQGEVFTWGEEGGGRLGHGLDQDFDHPRLVEFLAVNNVDYVACGEFHTCAISASGDLFTWGDGVHNAGLLGQETDVSHWIPKRISGTLEGIQVLSVSCGSWHSAIITSNGKLFTYGDGTFGVLGHGNRESVLLPKEVQLLSGLKTIKVACGVWHTAAVVEVMDQMGTNISSGKLFTWGEGDTHCLGHGNKDACVLPKCVSSLLDYNFHQVACGHTLTVALATSGHVFTMGKAIHGQLGNPTADEKVPCLVQGGLAGEFVDEVSCGAFHVAALTSRSEVFTWGRGANGQLGHGDTEDRRTPTPIDALKDKHVRSVACGSNFSTCICIHRWSSGLVQSSCYSCHQAFGFTRKRHNCYNCGQVHCHACSSKKALKANLAPTPGKPYRVCDACYIKLKAAEANHVPSTKFKITTRRPSIDAMEKTVKGEGKYSRMLFSPFTELGKYTGKSSGNTGLKAELSPSRNSHTLQPGPLQSLLRPAPSPAQATSGSSRGPSPYSRRPSPPRVRSVFEGLLKTSDMAKLQNQIDSLREQCEAQETEIQKLRKEANDACLLAEEEISKCKMAKVTMKFLREKLTSLMVQLPSDIRESENFQSTNAQIDTVLQRFDMLEASPENTNSEPCQSYATTFTLSANGSHDHRVQGESNHELSNSFAHKRQIVDVENHRGEPLGAPTQSYENEARSLGEEQVEQFEHGVFVSYVQSPSGVKIFKRVRFSKRKFQEQQAAIWFKENKDRLFMHYLQLESSLVPSLPVASCNNGEANETEQS